MRPALLTAVLVLGSTGRLAADAPLADTSAFEYANAVSFYGFDGCGDGLGGRLYRRALADKFAHCPFDAAARTRFDERSRAQREKSSAALQRMIVDHGGLPMRLEGMSRTCHEQMASPEYQALRGKLEQYADGAVPVEAVLPAPCDAANLTP